jgi:hypothetical protein
MLSSLGRRPGPRAGSDQGWERSLSWFRAPEPRASAPGARLAHITLDIHAALPHTLALLHPWKNYMDFHA